MARFKNMPYITAAEASEILGISKRTLFRWEEEGRINSKREGILKVRLYDKDYITQSAEILRLNRLEKEHLAKLPAIRERVKQHLFVQDVHALHAGEPMKFMDVDAATKAFDDEEAWMAEHKRILNELFLYPRDRLRQLLTDLKDYE